MRNGSIWHQRSIIIEIMAPYHIISIGSSNSVIAPAASASSWHQQGGSIAGSSHQQRS